MARIRSAARTPFASALLGGLVVALAGWLAIAAGWIEAGDEPDAVTAALPLTQAATGDSDGEGLSVAQIYGRSAAGVINVSAERSGGGAQLAPFGPAPEGGGTATGSGFVIDGEGHIVTNAHVVEGAERVSVKLGEDGETLEAKLLGADPSTDIAVLEVDPGEAELEPLPLGDSGEVSVGDPVIAIGNPFGLDRTATAGIVSAVQREISAPNGFTIREAIQTDAPINPGNSGGPLIDAAGRVIGVNSQIESPAGGNVGIGFAVPVGTAAEVAQQLIADGEVEHAFLGISGADLTPELADVLNLEADGGALVQAVVPDSPADEAGIEPGDAEVTIAGARVRAGGDVIVEVDGEPVASMDEVIAAVDGREPGDAVELTLLRDGETRTVGVELAERPAQAGPR